MKHSSISSTALLLLTSSFRLTNGLSACTPQSRRAVLLSSVPSAVTAVGVAASVVTTAPAVAAAETTAAVTGLPPTTFRRYPQLRFIAALGDPRASSGTGADAWGLWRDDPGPRGVYLRDYERRELGTRAAPAGWTLDRDAVWIEEHGLIMPSPGDLPRRSFVRATREILPYKRYVVTGDRKVTTVLTVFEDGRWDLAQGASLYDVTHLPCRSAKYTPAPGTPSGSCVPSPSDQSTFPVKPGAVMPPLSSTGCAQLDYAVLFVLGEEALN